MEHLLCDVNGGRVYKSEKMQERPFKGCGKEKEKSALRPFSPQLGAAADGDYHYKASGWMTPAKGLLQNLSSLDKHELINVHNTIVRWSSIFLVLQTGSNQHVNISDLAPLHSKSNDKTIRGVLGVQLSDFSFSTATSIHPLVKVPFLIRLCGQCIYSFYRADTVISKNIKSSHLRWGP